MKTRTKTQKINVVTLGCSKNLVDSEVLMKQLKANDLKVLHNSNDSSARTVVINTCGFIGDAKQESIDTILQFARAKEEGKIDRLFVMGCLSERYKDDLKKEITEVDQFFGTRNLRQIVESIGADYKNELLGERMLTTPKHFAYLKVSEGCDKNCAFCAIPLMRGRHISRPIEEIVREAEFLSENGVKEIMIIAQDLSYYGIDLYREQRLPELIEKLSDVRGIEWIRLHYAYPSYFPADVLRVMRERSNVCNYLDMPFQHISSNMLRIMRRGYTRQWTYDLVDLFRKQVPDITLRTTLLVGHPGETEADFEDLKDFVRQSRFDRLGVFPYSHEEDTHSHKTFPDSIPAEVKQQRADEIMEIQSNISHELNQAKIGKTFKVLIDRAEDEYYVGRTEADSPEVDNEVLVKRTSKNLHIGDFYNVHITGADEYDLYGEWVK